MGRAKPPSPNTLVMADTAFRRLLEAREIRYILLSSEQRDISERVALVTDALGETMVCEYPSDDTLTR